MSLSQNAWNIFHQYPAKRYHVEADTANGDMATLIVSADDGLQVQTLKLGFPVANNIQRRELLTKQRLLQNALNDLCIERRQRLISEIQTASAICSARIAAMQAHNDANKHSGSPPDYGSSSFFAEANTLELLADKLRTLV